MTELDYIASAAAALDDQPASPRAMRANAVARAWAVRTRDGEIIIRTIRRRRENAAAAWLLGINVYTAGGPDHLVALFAAEAARREDRPELIEIEIKEIAR